MKFCKKCNKVYPSEAKFCPACGELLEAPLQTDIFGELMDDRVDKIKNEKRIEEIKSSNDKDYCIYNDFDKTNRTKKIALIKLIISCVCWMVPFFGQIILGSIIYTNVGLYNNKLVKKHYIIIPTIMFVLSIFWVILLFYFKVFDSILNNQ